MKPLRFLVGAAAGVVYGMLFAQKSGKKLRSDLAKSKTPIEDLFGQLKRMGHDSFEWAQESEDLRKVMDSGKEQFDSLVKNAKELGEEGKELMIEKLEELKEQAETSVAEIKDDLEKTAQKGHKRFKNSVEGAKKDAKKAVKTAKKVAKKAEKHVKKVAKKITN